MEWVIFFKDEAARLLVERDALHIYVAVIIQITTALTLRCSLGSLKPWTAVLIIELFNEAHDLAITGGFPLTNHRVQGGVHDIVNTMVMPTLLIILARNAPKLFAWSKPVTG